MPTEGKLVVVRHAQSERNAVMAGSVHFTEPEVRERFRGIPDHRIGITSKGWTQARAAGLFLKQQFGVFDEIWTSGYLRTEQTTEGILEAYSPEERVSIPIKRSCRLRERESGYTFNMLQSEVDSNFPWFAEYWKQNGPFLARPIGGESLADVAERVEILLQFFMKSPQKTRLLCVHGRVIMVIRFLLERWSFEEAEHFLSEKNNSPKNCGVTVYKYNSKQFRMELESYNRVALGKVLQTPCVV